MGSYLKYSLHLQHLTDYFLPTQNGLWHYSPRVLHTNRTQSKTDCSQAPSVSPSSPITMPGFLWNQQFFQYLASKHNWHHNDPSTSFTSIVSRRCLEEGSTLCNQYWKPFNQTNSYKFKWDIPLMDYHLLGQLIWSSAGEGSLGEGREKLVWAVSKVGCKG